MTTYLPGVALPASQTDARERTLYNATRRDGEPVTMALEAGQPCRRG